MLSPRLRVSDAAASLAAAQRGEGITVDLSYGVAPLLSAACLAPILEAFLPHPEPVHLVYPQARIHAPKVGAFVDFAVPRLRRRLAMPG